MEIGDIVTVIVNHPDGIETITEGDIGFITKIENVTGEEDYTVKTINSDYLYGVNQIRLATEDEIKNEFIRLIRFF